MFVINYQKLSIGLIVLSIILLLYNLTQVNFSDLSWSVNKEPYLGVIAMIGLLISGIYSYRYYKKPTETSNEEER